MNRPLMEYLKCPLHRYTFKVRTIREWVESNCRGYTLNLFAGFTELQIHELRNDIDIEALSEHHLDALDFAQQYEGTCFDTILLDPPYSYRKSMEMYKGNKCSSFKRLKDSLCRLLNPYGQVITFGYHSVSMGMNRGFYVHKIAVFSHGGAIHDTIATVEILE